MTLPHEITSYYSPTIYETKPGGMMRAWDVGSKLFEESRTIFVDGQFNDAMTRSVVQQLLYLRFLDPKKEVDLYVNSPGGVVTSGLAIYDTMQLCPFPINTTVMGMAASMGSFILMAGTGKRRALPNAKIMIHQPSGGFQGQASDIEIHARDILETRARLNAIYAKHTKQDIKAIEVAMERDNYMTPEQAKEFGLIDEILVPHER